MMSLLVQNQIRFVGNVFTGCSEAVIFARYIDGGYYTARSANWQMHQSTTYLHNVDGKHKI